MHWSDVLAEKALIRRSSREGLTVGSGISLSGPVHVGHSREFLTAALIAKAIERRGGKARFVAFADDVDPLRKVYPFLGPEYERWVGCPLVRIPDHCGCHANYAQHFLAELRESFEALRINPEVLLSSELYGRGNFSPLVQLTLLRRDLVNQILDRVAGRSSERTSGQRWPLMPECPRCHSIQKTEIKNWSGTRVEVHCVACGADSEVDLDAGGGKLIWRCDWPMRWAYLGVAVEPFGHDHNAAGGSYETGVALAKEVYGVEPPVPAPYSWVHFKAGGAMHSSSGKAISIAELARSYPTELIWWMFVRRDPMTMIPFDPVQSLFEEARLIREAAAGGDSDKLAALRIVDEAVGVRQSLIAYPFDHLVLAAQLGGFNPRATLHVLQRSKAYRNETTPVGEDELERIKLWLELYGGTHRIRIRSLEERPEGEPASFEVSEALKVLCARFGEVEWEAQILHNLIHDTAKRGGLKPAEVFSEIYRRVIGQRQGPKVGWLFETLGRERVMELLG